MVRTCRDASWNGCAIRERLKCGSLFYPMVRMMNFQQYAGSDHKNGSSPEAWERNDVTNDLQFYGSHPRLDSGKEGPVW